MNTLRHQALQIVLEGDSDQKAARTQLLDEATPFDATLPIAEPPGIPGRPARPELFANLQFKKKSLKTTEGRAVLVHSLAHIEFNAIDLALDVVWRFAGMPDAFYRQWIQVAKEEAYHFALLRDHLRSLGYDYGDFPAHNGLWDMAEKTKDDLLARLALVPRTLEARGLDATPAVKAKFISVGDQKAADILDIILRDEIGHVAVGNHWYRHLCLKMQLDPEVTYRHLAVKHQAPRLRPPFNHEARRQAGFTDGEINALLAST